MSDEDKTAPVKKKKSWLGRLFKLTLFLAVFFVIIFTVLSKIGGSEPHHQQIIEQYASEISGLQASIQNFNSLNFFPLIIIDFERMEFYERPAPGVDEFSNALFSDPVMYLNKAYVVSSFWDVMFGTGKFRILNLDKLYMIPGSFLSDDILFDKISIIENEDGTAHLQATGKVAETPFEIRKSVDHFGKAPKKSYRILHAAPLEMTFDDAEISITFNYTPANDLAEIPVTIISGTIQSDTLNADLLKPDARLNKNIAKLSSRMFNPKYPVELKCDIMLERTNGAEKVPLTCDDGILKMETPAAL